MESSVGIFENTAATAPPEHESFQEFFEYWMNEQDHDLQNLLSASQAHHRRHDEQSSSSSSDHLTATREVEEEEERIIRSLMNRVVHHYEVYYEIKHKWVKLDVLGILSPSWRSSLEEAFLWIGGWRPSMAFHLLYSKSGLQLEARLDDIIRGLTTGDLADLSASQLVRVDELQRKTIREENEITEKMAEHQETVADSSMVDLSHVVTELMRNGTELTPGGEIVERVKSILAPKEDGLERILEKADDLRLRTLKGVIDILTPIQAVDFLIAAAELHLRLHDWGKLRNANHCDRRGPPRAADGGGGGSL